MSLITCLECGKKISEQADFCPHCGYKNSPDIYESCEFHPEGYYSKNMFDTIHNILNNTELKFEPNYKFGYFFFNPCFVLKDSGIKITVILNVHRNDYTVMGILEEYYADENNKSEITEFMMRINRNFKYPNLFLNYSLEGRICAKACFDATKGLLTRENVVNNILKIINFFDMHIEDFISVYTGEKRACEF